MESCQEPKSMSKLQRTEGAAGRLSLGPAAQGVDTHTHVGEEHSFGHGGRGGRQWDLHTKPEPLKACTISKKVVPKATPRTWTYRKSSVPFNLSLDGGCFQQRLALVLVWGLNGPYLCSMETSDRETNVKKWFISAIPPGTSGRSHKTRTNSLEKYLLTLRWQRFLQRTSPEMKLTFQDYKTYKEIMQEEQQAGGKRQD